MSSEGETSGYGVALSLLTAKLHCRQYKESTSLRDKVAIVLEVKVALTMAKLAVLQ